MSGVGKTSEKYIDASFGPEGTLTSYAMYKNGQPPKGYPDPD